MTTMPQLGSPGSAGASAPIRQRAALDPFVAELQHCILAALPDGGATLDAIATSLGFSERTLQRRLQRVNLNFQQLVERLRFDAARRYLVHGNQPLTEIGYQLGYSEPSAFSRAFRRWSGVSPLAYRRRN